MTEVPIARFALAKPDEIELTLTLTMSRRQWQQLRDGLDASQSQDRLGSMIDTMLRELGPRLEVTYSTTGWSGAQKEAERISF
jgi:hypothetical protein